MSEKEIKTEILEPLGVPTFVKSRTICILRVGSSSRASLPRGLVAHFSKTCKAGEVGFGYLNIAVVDLENWFVKSYVQARLDELGWSKDDNIKEGYYLFFDGRLAAFHNGKPDILSDGTAQLAALGGILSIFAENKIGENVANRVAKSRGVQSMISYFEEKIRWLRLSKIKIPIFAPSANQPKKKRFRKSARTRRKRTYQQAPLQKEEELRKAYELLKVSVNSTNKEIKDARKKLIRTWHPDRFQQNSFLGDFPEKQTKEINRAFDLIMESREEEWHT